MRIAVALLLAAAVVGGCATKDYAKEGANADQYTKDQAQCRSQVKAAAAQDRDIEDQRRAVFSGERDRFGQQDLYKTMDNQGYERNVNRLMTRCMEARGWAPKRTSPFPDLSW